MKVFLLGMMILSYTALASPVLAQSVAIKGTVVLESAQATAGQTYSDGYQTGTSGGQARQADVESDDILIWLENKNKDFAYQGLESDIQVLNQVNKRFSPRLIAVRVGDSVRVKNSDPFYHNVFSLSKTKQFDVGRRSPGDHRDMVFNKAGVVDVFCDIHSNMHAVIRVLPEHTLTWKQLDGSGAFHFENIPEGEYTLYFFASGNRKKSLDIKAVDTEIIVLDMIRL